MKMKKTKTVKKSKKLPASNETSAQMVRDIMNGNNVHAYKCLEKRLREKVAEKIDNALKDA